MALRRKKTKQHKTHQPAAHHQTEHQADQPPDVYQAASQAVEQDEWPEYAERKVNKKLILVVVVVVIVLAIAGGVYALLKNHKSKSPAKTASTSQQIQPTPSSTGSSNGTSTYTAKGSDLNLSFTYPNNWTASPASGTDTSDQTITVSSPSTTIEDANNQNVTGKVVVTIRPGTATISELNSGNPTVALNSMQFAYSAPASDQTQYPYLTFIHFSSGSSASGAFEETMITGITPFTKGQAISSDSLSSLDPIIAANIDKCSNTACSGTGAGVLSITNDTWTNDSLFVATQNLFKSLKLN